MKRLFLVAALSFAAVSFAMNYTGNVYVNKARASEVLYLSVGCTAKNDSGVVKAIGKNDIMLADKDAFGWSYGPVKSLLQGDTIAPFCFYRSRPDSTAKKVVDADGDVSYYYDRYYKSTKIFTAKDFNNQEDLYIDFDKNDLLLYRDSSVPTVCFKPGRWVTYYVIVNDKSVKLQKKKDEDWIVVHDELKVPYIRVLVKLDTVVSYTLDSIPVKETVYDTLAVDSLYKDLSGKIAFTDGGMHYVYAEEFEVADASGGYYISKLGIDLSLYKSDTIYVFENPKKEHSTLVRTKAPDQVYSVHVLPPQTVSWFGEIPVLVNGTSGEKSTTKVYDENCGWFTSIFFEESIPTKASYVGKENSALSFAEGLNLDSLFKALKTTELFYVVNDSSKAFWYKKNPEVNGICSVELQGIVYDTDASLHPAFSCYSVGGEGCQAISGTAAQDVDKTVAMAAINACIGVTPGIVDSVLGADNKPVLSKAGETCFIKSEYFNQLFNSTEGVNETTCSTIPFMLNNEGKWEFLSDAYTSPGAPVIGGYYPVELTKDADVVVGSPLAAARTKRPAEGPVFVGPKLREIDSVENVSRMNLLCKGPAWDKGIDCSGLFADGEDLTAPLTKYLGAPEIGELCVWGWSCPPNAPDGWPLFKDYETLVGGAGINASAMSYETRWYSPDPGRNQHFCFESHAKFTYKKGQKFGVRGDDDIWIFIDGKLVIDLGGTHLAAPGYADLSRVKGKNGEPLVVGKSYDIDIFFCDRRTTMSNMNIFSNFYLDQSESIEKMKPCKVDVKNIFDDDSLSGHTVVQRSVVLPAKIDVVVEGRLATVSGVKPGSELTLMDMQGRVIGRYLASTANVKIEIRNAGRYILKTKSGLQPFTIK